MLSCYSEQKLKIQSINQSLVYLTADKPQLLSTIHNIKRKMMMSKVNRTVIRTKSDHGCIHSLTSGS